MSAGYVYVLSNPSMPGLVKIGRSKHGGRTRAKDLYKTATGVPAPFKMEFEIWVPDSVYSEMCVHEELSDCRYSGNREFFELDTVKAIEAVMRVAGYDYDLLVRDLDEAISADTVLPEHGEQLGVIAEKYFPGARVENVIMHAIGYHLTIEHIEDAVKRYKGVSDKIAERRRAKDRSGASHAQLTVVGSER